MNTLDDDKGSIKGELLLPDESGLRLTITQIGPIGKLAKLEKEGRFWTVLYEVLLFYSAILIFRNWIFLLYSLRVCVDFQKDRKQQGNVLMISFEHGRDGERG